MRLADLIGALVTDSAGREVGHVSDVRLVEVEAPGHDTGTRLRVEGLVVALRWHGRLLAYDHRPVHGPRPLAWLTRRSVRRARWVPWDRVAHHRPAAAVGERGALRLTTTADELLPLERAHHEWND
ncbi:PRC-barrel domain-containing protein [Streptomyces sp. NPDC054842]